MENFSQTAAFIWSVADLLRGDFKQSQYGRVILPFTLLRRLECVLEADKAAVLAAHEKVKGMGLPEDAAEKMVLRATKQAFFNTSPMTLATLGETGIKDNLENYVQCFSRDAREIFEYFKFDEFIGQLNDVNLLFKVVQKFKDTDLSPERLSNHEMGLVFEELIRRFAESSNETAGEHFTPRDIVHLTTSLVFMEDDAALTKEGIIRTVYDPTAGTGGFLSSGMEYVVQMNNNAVIRAYGQELNPESYAICKADMLIKGQEVNNIKLGNTLSNDQLYADKFDYMLSNPPFGVDWKKVEGEIKDEHTIKGYDGRFGPGLPRVSDGSLLFLMHLISKLRDRTPSDGDSIEGGGRIGIILNGSPLFTGGAGSGESEIRRYILETDLLETIVALPTDMFYNTGIATYIWVLSNKKPAERKGKVQLINGVNLSSKMRKSLGSKRKYLTEDDIRTITREFGAFDEASATDPTNGQPLTKIFNTTDFGYRRLTIERPLRLSVQMDDTRLEALRFAPKPFNAPMQWIWEQFGQQWSDATYGELAAFEKEIRVEMKASFPELKEKQIKDLLSAKLWREQKALLDAAKQLCDQLAQQMGEGAIVSGQCDDFNQFEDELKKALKATAIKLDAKQKKQLLDAITWKNPQAARVIKKVLKEEAQPKYGAFEATVNGKPAVVEYQPDGDLRDNENVPLDPSKRVEALIEAYFDREVAPHVPDAWIDANKRDDKDGEIGIVGYEIPFNRHFYVYQPPRSLEEIDADLDKVSADIMSLLQEVHS
ncbi:type I restriction-modification system subunit M [Marinobacterium mangrovicola]|uniref:site-specific DNA-methyltransferase (adenine-specific) n=1 Tax=Marinobacterium mangrovicola TaxID=1476959 RepID=A0A4R1GP07_9GAMM|nr:class I SAM-dependent DNA methyltransferase [Marinobacterium mangrovicola]TCK09131.1 type I restriction enzyme M protein [Marinobacterium mangrovicola]